ncbi:MAG: DUF2339 domain-containing protein [Novosphingobium sp.]|uniref:DUF2339 domain-containing protein n=1 Tax=Novosphingobium sp. TaxID=1874826 RepID=UPI003C7E0EE5
MVWWTLVAGALIGWASAGFSEFGLILGAIFGTPMGFWLRSVMRAETDQMISQRIASLYIPEAGSFDYEREERPEPAPPFGTVPASAASPLPAAAQPVPAEPAMAMAAAGEPLAQSEHDHIAATPNRDPDRPSLPEELAQKAIGWLLGGNTIVRVGLVVLFIGLAFLARLVANSGLFPIEARLATVGAAGAALLAVGYWKRLERPDFGLHLQGAGVAVLYLTVFAAARIFEVMPPGAAFAFMILFAALGAALALLQNSQTMALASFLGGFAVPFLLGGSAETPTGLFTYITVLNAAIMGIAWKKSWRPLNLLGFAATFLLAGLWGFGAYENRHFIICEVFLAFSIAIYLATALLYAHNTPGKLGNFADSTLLFGTAIAGFGLQAGLVHDKPFASAWSAVVFGAVYLAVATWAFRRRNQGMGLLSESLLAIGLGFVTMAIPLALELKWVSVAWLLEGAGALWVGARQARWMPRAFGLLLQAAGALLVLTNLQPNVAALPLANPGFIEPALAALALLFAAWVLRPALPDSGSRWALIWQKVERGLDKPWFLAGFAIACLAVMQEVTRRLPPLSADDYPAALMPSHHELLLAMLLVLGLMTLADWLGRRQHWAVASWPGRISLLLIGWSFLISLVMGRYVLQMPDLLAWTAAFALHFWMLQRADRNPETAAPRWNGFMHAAGVLGLTVMLADALFYLIEQADLWGSSWAGVMFLIAGVAVLMGLTRWAGPASVGERGLTMGWPHNVHSRAYWWRAAAPLAVVLYFGALLGTVIAQGVTDPLPYIPLLNPIDLSIALVLVSLALWRQMLQGADPQPKGSAPFTGSFALGAGALLVFVWINTVWVRTAHHWLGAQGGVLDPGQSQIVLTGFSILWTLMAMGLMLLGRARQQRLPWLAGAALLVVVVAKLVFVDMSAIEGFARIVAFIGVGVLMLLIGYFVPLPPRSKEAEA